MSEPLYTTSPPLFRCKCDHFASDHGLALQRCAVCDCPAYAPGHAGDGPCMDCGTRNTPIWFTDNALWNLVVGGPDALDDPGGFLCPWCFTQRAYAAGLAPTSWEFIPQFQRWEGQERRREMTADDSAAEEASA